MTLCISVGNPLRGDDGVAHRVLELLEPTPGFRFLRCHQLTPELSESIAGAKRVLFIDASLEPGPVRMERIDARLHSGTPLGHAMTANEVVALAVRLFGFRGEAFLCHVPAADFDGGEKLSAEAENNAHRAREIIEALG